MLLTILCFFCFIRKGVGLIHDYFFIQKIKLWVALLIFEGLQAVCREHCEAGGDFIKTTQKVASLHSVIESIETASCVVLQNHVRFLQNS